jgi:glycosyltransferase involved in cell wall biosynthesis
VIKVGIDVRCLAKPLTGIGRYTLEMCRALSERDDICLHLYSPSQIHHKILDQCPDAAVDVPLKKMKIINKIYRQLWSEIYLPLRIKRDKVDVFWGPAHHLPFLLSTQIPSVVTIHDLVWKYAGETMRPLNRLFEKIRMPHAIWKADRVVADSYSTQQEVLKEFKVHEDKISVIYLGKPQRQTVPPFEDLISLALTCPYFLFVGTIEPRKNLTHLLKAYAQLSEDTKQKAQLVIVGGSGWGHVNLLETIDELNLNSHVVILGYVDDAVLPALYAHAQFLAMPSLYEGFGLPLVEAMVYGTPVLTSDKSSMPEVVGDAGILIDPLDAGSIREGLKYLIENVTLRTDLAEKALKNGERFSWERAANQLVDVFKRVIENDRIAAP